MFTVYEDVRARSQVRDCMDSDPTEIPESLVRELTTLASLNECTGSYTAGLLANLMFARAARKLQLA